MTRTHLIVAAAAAACSTLASAAVISVDTSNSGRLAESTSGDDQFGSSAFGFETLNNSLVGDNGGNAELFAVYSYEVTPDFATDFNNGFLVQFDTFIGTSNSGTNEPIGLYVLTVNGDGSSSLASVASSNGGTLVDTIDPDVTGLSTAYSVDVTAALTTQSGGTLTAGEVIYLGVDPTQTTNGIADNFRFGVSAADSTVSGGVPLDSTLTTVIPEPTSALAAAAGLGGLLLRRRSA